MSIYDLNAYEVIQTEDLSDLKSKGTLLKHKKSGARVLLMEMMMRTRCLRLDSAHHRQTVQEFHTLWNILFCADRKNSR